MAIHPGQQWRDSNKDWRVKFSKELGILRRCGKQDEVAPFLCIGDHLGLSERSQTMRRHVISSIERKVREKF